MLSPHASYATGRRAGDERDQRKALTATREASHASPQNVLLRDLLLRRFRRYHLRRANPFAQRLHRPAGAEAGAGARSKDTRQVVTELNILGALYRLCRPVAKGARYLNEALPIEQKASSLFGQATTLDTMGRVYTDLGQEDKALALLNQALPLWRALARAPAKPTR